ncbi:trigger factor [Acetobacteraceae bacterium]|nr:trigger factor [Acetobacteraceae bacterium]
MKITPVAEKENLIEKFTVTISNEDCEVRVKESLQKYGADLKLPGFRPGKVPLSIVKQRFGQSAQHEAVDALIQKAWEEILKENDFRPAGQPKVKLISFPFAGEGEEADASKELSFEIEVSVLPEIKIPDVSDIKLTRHVSKISDDSVEKALKEVSEQSRFPKELEEKRPSEEGDIVRVDFLGKKDGTPFEGGAGKGVDVELGGAGFIPGFAEQMVGMSAGEKKVINVTFPKDYQAEELAGKEVTFDIDLLAIMVPTTYPVGEELAKAAGFENLDKLKEDIRTRLEAEAKELSNLSLKRDMLDALIGKVDFEISDEMVESEFNQIWSHLQQERSAGRIDPSEALKDEDTLKTEYRAIAKRRVSLGLLLSEIAQKEKMEVSQEELMGALQAEIARFPGQEQKVLQYFLGNEGSMNALKGPILEGKVMDFLLEKVEISEDEIEMEALAKLVSEGETQQFGIRAE